MKRLIAAAGVAAVFTLVAAPAQAQMKAPKGEKATVTGQVIDISCKYALGASGPEHVQCAQVCADKGIPLGILASDGTLYIPIGSAMADAQNPRLKEFAEQTVTVSGEVVPAGGAKAIKIESIKKAS